MSHAECWNFCVVTVPQLILTYVVATLGTLCGVGLFAEYRRRSFEPASTEDTIYRCRKCGYVYTDEPDLDRSRCSQCGQVNEPIRF